MFYHIRIDYFDKKLKVNQTLYCFDITDRKTVDDKVRKYLYGESLLFAGTKLSSEDIRHFRVFQSQYDIEKCKKIGDSRIGPNIIFVYTKDTILEVTDLCPEITDEIFEKVEASANKVSSGISESEKDIDTRRPPSKKIFIVQGHDNATRSEVELLIKKLGYHPIVLFKQPDGGATIIEKLEREISDISFAIILYTGCDEGKTKDEKDLKPRARQNVVFEHGLMCGILGRKKVVALVEPGIEIPGDLTGIIYKTIDAAGNWQLQVAREMKAAGLQVDLNLLF